MLADLSSTLNGPFMRSMTDAFYEADKRTREDYDKQVDGYIAKAMKAMPAFILRKSIERGLGRLALFRPQRYRGPDPPAPGGPPHRDRRRPRPSTTATRRTSTCPSVR